MTSTPRRAVGTRRVPKGVVIAAATLGCVAAVGAGAVLATGLRAPEPAVAARAPMALPATAGLGDNPARRGASTLTSCAHLADADGWVATGTARNEAGKSAVFTVTVFFSADGRPLTFAQSRVTVPAGRTRPWTAVQRFDTGGAALTCGLVAVS